jgi:hypothetical protein
MVKKVKQSRYRPGVAQRVTLPMVANSPTGLGFREIFQSGKGFQTEKFEKH